MKRFVLSILMIVSLSFLCGFTFKPNNIFVDDFIMLSLDFSANGQIVQSIDFGVNSGRLNSESISVKEELDFKNALTKQIESLRNEFLFSFALAYISQPNEEYKINKGVLLTPVTFDEKSDTMGFKIAFTSLKAWQYYHTSSNEESDKHNITNIFINKIESEGIFPFSSQIKVSENEMITIGERYKERYLTAAQGLSFYEKLLGMYQPHFIYNYSSFNNKLHSDATYSFTDNLGHLHHVWLVKDNQINENYKINLYYYSIEKGVWLIFAIVLPLFAMIFTMLIIKMKDKNKKA